MTTIARDGTTLVADRRSTCEGAINTVTKIWRANGLLISASGNASGARAFRAWVEGGAQPDKYPKMLVDGDTWGLTIDARGVLRQYEKTPHPIEMEQTQYALGSGAAYARAAMRCGKTAREAVLIASEFDAYTGGQVDELQLPQRDMMTTFSAGPVESPLEMQPYGGPR